MIYCVIPPELEGELLEKLTAYYEDNPDVTVIVDRRRRSGVRETPAATLEVSRTRERRRVRIPGTFPSLERPG